MGHCEAEVSDAYMLVAVATDNDPSPFYATRHMRVHRDPVQERHTAEDHRGTKKEAMRIWRHITDGMSLIIPLVAIDDENDALAFAAVAIAGVSTGLVWPAN
jgi:hypothetical protein